MLQGDSLARGPKLLSIKNYVINIERRQFWATIMSRSCLASFPVCLYKVSSHYLSNIIFIDHSLGPLARESPCSINHYRQTISENVNCWRWVINLLLESEVIGGNNKRRGLDLRRQFEAQLYLDLCPLTFHQLRTALRNDSRFHEHSCRLYLPCIGVRLHSKADSAP